MVSVQIEAATATTTAIVLPGSGGRADADMTAVFFGHTDVGLEVSLDNSQWTEAPGASPLWQLQGFTLYVPGGMYLRVRNNSASTVRTCVLAYRYTGSLS